MSTILFEPKYNIGDVVYLKINPEIKFVVDGYLIFQVDENKQVDYFNYSLYNATGEKHYYGDLDLELLESIDKK